MLAAIIGGVVYAFSTGTKISVVQSAGVAILLAAPVALPTSVVAISALNGLHSLRVRPLVRWPILVVFGAALVFAFPVYMHVLAPASAWHRALILPIATVLAALAIWKATSKLSNGS